MSDRTNDQLVPLFTQDLDLLEWFANWTPEVHQANWKTRRTWPPGFREAADMSGTWAGSPKGKAIIYRLADTGVKNTFRLIRDKFLPFRLVEGSITCARLTPRGRAALKFYGRECPEAFESHCPEIFDDVSLRVRFNKDFQVTHLDSLKSSYGHGDIMDDTAETWRAFLVEYNENVYSQRGSGQSATVSMLNGSSTGTSLNGSLREHSTVITVCVQNNAHEGICEFNLSLEQLADMLTSNGDVPCTVGSYYGRDGMRYQEPAPPVVSAYKRMQARLENQTDSQATRIDELLADIEAGKYGKMGKKGQEALLFQLGIVRELGVKNHAYTAEQTLEEVSQVIEGAATILRDRANNGTLAITGGGALAGLLGSDDSDTLLIEVKDD